MEAVFWGGICFSFRLSSYSCAVICSALGCFLFFRFFGVLCSLEGRDDLPRFGPFFCVMFFSFFLVCFFRFLVFRFDFYVLILF